MPRRATLFLILFFLPAAVHTQPASQQAPHLRVFAGLSGYWAGELRVRLEDGGVSTQAVALHARLTQDGRTLIMSYLLRDGDRVVERLDLVTYDTDSLTMQIASVEDGIAHTHRYRVQGLERVRTPYAWAIRRVEIGQDVASRSTDRMTADSLVISSEALAGGAAWSVRQQLLLQRRPRPEPVGFLLPGFENAREVSVIGDFNGWTPGLALMHRTRGGWQLELPLPPGEYQYKFSVDGVPVNDLLSSTIIKDGKGSFNALKTVR